MRDDTTEEAPYLLSPTDALLDTAVAMGRQLNLATEIMKDIHKGGFLRDAPLSLRMDVQGFLLLRNTQ